VKDALVGMVLCVVFYRIGRSLRFDGVPRDFSEARSRGSSAVLRYMSLVALPICTIIFLVEAWRALFG